MNAKCSHYYNVVKTLSSLSGQWPYQRPRTRLFCVILMTLSTISMIVPQMKVLIDQLFVDWKELKTPEEYEIMKRYAKNGRRYSLGYSLYCYFAVYVFMSVSLIPQVLDVVLPLNESRPILPTYPGYYFIDERKYFFYSFSHAIIAWEIAMTGIVTHDCMLLTYIEHVCSIFALVGLRFERLMYKQNDTVNILHSHTNKAYRKRIAFSVHTHRKALNNYSSMTDTRSLREAIEQYEIQLSQVDVTLSTTPKGPDRDNLLSLKSDIAELISLTKESLQNLEKNVEKNKDNNSEDKTEDLLDKEYALFKAELEKSSDSENKQDGTTAAVSDSIEDELKELEGMKCKAPHGSTWGGIGYYNAMVSSVYRDSDKIIKDIHDIKVRVFFLNPTHKEMIPCPYFLNGSCKFSDENCHYCHGEIVPFSSLQEYKEPDFCNIKVGSKVLIKKNNIWHRSVVLKLPEKDDEYRVKFESSGKIVEADLQDLLPLDDTNLDITDTSDDDDKDDDNDDNDVNNINNDSKLNSHINDHLIHKSLLTLQSNESLGNWEKHTRGMGSKLMMQMGYVIGTGLGKRSDGRIEPVEAQVLPAGKSLDHCMELREFAGNDKNLFTAERKMRKQQKLEQQRERQYQREKQKEDSDVFNFINKTLGDKPKEDAANSSQSKDKFRTESNRNLNVASFQIGENINRLQKESLKLKESLAKHTKGSVLYNNILIKYNEKQKELNNLKISEKSIIAEQNQRKNKAKLSVF